jgi:hypothetical protein
LAFLTGEKQGLVIIGRGLGDREQLLETKFGETVVWTYDLLLDEARGRWNANVQEQYRLLGLPPERPF